MEAIDIKKKYNELTNELKKAVSNMELSDKVFAIRDEIKALQTLCPHNVGHYDFSQTDECPYCGKKFKG